MNITFGIRKGLLGFGLFLLFALTSCDKKDIPFGENFVESFTDIVIVDTITPVLSTYKLDSFATSGTGTLLLGSYKDPKFGKITASSTFQLALPAFSIGTDDVYDSLTFILTPNGEYYGDTAYARQISVHELTQTLELPVNKTAFYNLQPSFAFNPTELGKRQMFFKPSRLDSVEIRLNQAKGAEIFQKMKSKSTEVLTQADWLRYFRGITVRPGTSDSTLLGFRVTDSTLKMRLYYREKGVTFTNRYIDFPVTNSALQYNKVDIDRSQTPLAGLPSGYPLVASASLGNEAFTQYASGIIAKINFPTLQTLLNLDKAGKILRAELTVQPVPGTYKYPYRMPAQLELAATGKTNLLGATQSTATLFTDYITGENTGYTFDITSFLQSQINVNVQNQLGLFMLSTSASQFNRLVVGDVKAAKPTVKVKIYYLVIK